MNIKTAKVLRNISRTALLVCVFLLLGLGIYYTYLSIRFRPYKVRVSNVTDSAFTVSWVTDEPMVGVVYYGEKDSFLPGPLSWLGKKRAFDDRDVSDAQTECVSKFNKKVSKNRDENFTVDASGFDCNEVKVIKKGQYYTHHVTVPNLDADKEYYFRVGNGYISFKEGKTKGVEYIEREMPAVGEFKQKTRGTIKDISSPKPAYGTSYNVFYSSDGQVGTKKSFDSVIFLKTFKSGDQYPLMSAVTNNDGGWSIDLSNVRGGDGKSLNMEGTYLEFIPQVDNARPGASGTTKFEDLSFPLDLMGNNVDDLNAGLDREGSELARLLNGFVNQSYAAKTCYDANANCAQISVQGVTCKPALGHYSTESRCRDMIPVATRVTCWQDRCPAKSAEMQSCGGDYPRTSSPVCRTCYKCDGSNLLEKDSNASGNCSDGYQITRPNCGSTTTTTPTNTTDGGGSTQVGTKTCCKVTGVKNVGGTMKARCDCKNNQTACTSGYVEYLSKSVCETSGTKVLKCGCENGKQKYAVYKVGGGSSGNTEMLSFFEKLFIKKSYANEAGGGGGLVYTFTADENCASVNRSGDNGNSKTELADTCNSEDKSLCQKCYSISDCSVLYVDNKENCPNFFTDSYLNCGFEFDTTDSEVFKPSSYLHLIQDGGRCTGNGITKRIVSGGCNSGCWLQYRHGDQEDSPVCVNIPLKDDIAFCSNEHCGDLQKARNELTDTTTKCLSNWCKCPEGSAHHSVTKGYSCDAGGSTPQDDENKLEDTEGGGQQCCYKNSSKHRDSYGYITYEKVDCTEKYEESFLVGLDDTCLSLINLTVAQLENRKCGEGKIFNMKTKKCENIDYECKVLEEDEEGNFVCNTVECLENSSSIITKGSAIPRKGSIYKYGLCDKLLGSLNAGNSKYKKCWQPRINNEGKLQCMETNTLYSQDCSKISNKYKDPTGSEVLGYTKTLYTNVNDCGKALSNVKDICLDDSCKVIPDKNTSTACQVAGGELVTYQAGQSFCTPTATSESEQGEPASSTVDKDVCCFDSQDKLKEREECKEGDKVKLISDNQNGNANSCDEAIWADDYTTKSLEVSYCLAGNQCNKVYNVGENNQGDCFDKEYGEGSCNEALGWNKNQIDKTYNPTTKFCGGSCPQGTFYGPVIKYGESKGACISGNKIYGVNSSCTEELQGYSLDTSGKNIVYFEVACDEKWKNECLYHEYNTGNYQENTLIRRGIYDCCKFADGYYAIVQRPSNNVLLQCFVNNVPREVVDWSYCKTSFFSPMYCVKEGSATLDVTAYFYPSHLTGLGCPEGRTKVGEFSEGGIKVGGVWYACTSYGTFKRYDWYDLRVFGSHYIGSCITDGGIHPGAVQGISDSQVLGVKDNKQEEKESPLLFLPSEGVYSISESGNNMSVLSNGNTEVLFFMNRDGVQGYQAPKDPNNPKDNEDILVDQSAITLNVSQKTSAKHYELKSGINIISFDFFPSEGEQAQLMSNRFLELVNQTGYKVSRISYFGAGQWDGGNTYDFETGEVKGAPFALSQGKGYVIVAERDTTITVPGYTTNTPIPVAFSSGWNLIGVHGHDTQYTAKSLINSVNSIEGLKANNVTYWPTSKGMYQGFQLSEGQEYGQDFPISKDLGYFVRINEIKEDCRSIWWNPDGEGNGKCNTQ